MKDLLQSFVQAFAGVDLEAASKALAVDAEHLRARHRVTVALPSAPADAFYVVYSRTAPDASMLEMHRANPCDFDAFDTAEAGEVLNLLVDDGYHRVHAVRVRRRALSKRELMLAVPADPELGVLLYEGDVTSDVGLA